MYQPKPKKEIQSILSDKNLFPYMENILYHLIKSLIHEDVHFYRRINESLPSIFFELVDLVCYDPHLNPNYAPALNADISLLDMVFDSKNYYLMNKLLNHPKTDLNAIKGWFRTNTVRYRSDPETMEFLLMNPKFCELKPNWLSWLQHQQPRSILELQSGYQEDACEQIRNTFSYKHWKTVLSVCAENELPTDIAMVISIKLYGLFAHAKWTAEMYNARRFNLQEEATKFTLK